MEKLTLVECLNHQGTIMGAKGTEYFLFSAVTSDETEINVMLSENLIKKAGFKTTLLDYVSGSVLKLGDEKDLNDRSIVTATATERIERVLNGEIYEKNGTPYSFVLCTAAIDFLIASENAKAIKREDGNATNAKVVVEKEKQRKLDALANAQARLMERLRKKATTTTPPQDENQDDKDVPEKTTTPAEKPAAKGKAKGKAPVPTDADAENPF